LSILLSSISFSLLCRFLETAIRSHRELAIFLLGERHPWLRELLDKKSGDVMRPPVLQNLFLQARLKKPSNPRDKTFAFFSVLNKLKIELPTPDYEKSVEDVYREAVVASIYHNTNLHVVFDVPSDHHHLRPN
jgi:hypothetical protein